MIPFKNGRTGSWAGSRQAEPDTFWASYSDLMAGVLMVFVLITAITLVKIGTHLLEPAKQVEKWREVINDIRTDNELNAMNNVTVDCNTGALIITDENMRFGFNETKLGEDFEKTLREAVPKYLEIIHSKPKFMERIEILEISGHTDRVDTNYANPLVSRKRAGEALDFLMSIEEMKPFKNFLKEKAITAGYADTRFPKDCPEDKCAKARRVEIAVQLKDADVLEEFLKILDQLFRQKKT